MYVGNQLCATNLVVQSTTSTRITVSWKEPAAAPGLTYRITACLVTTFQCPFLSTCTECSSLEATGLLPNTSFTIMVDTFVTATGENCSSRGCTLNAVKAATEILRELHYISYVFSWAQSLDNDLSSLPTAPSSSVVTFDSGNNEHCTHRH